MGEGVVRRSIRIGVVSRRICFRERTRAEVQSAAARLAETGFATRLSDLWTVPPKILIRVENAVFGVRVGGRV